MDMRVVNVLVIFDTTTMGTSFFWVKYNGTTYQIVIEDGNYSKANLVNAIQNSLNIICRSKIGLVL